ncbi:MAG: response regulator [Myxococcales bacterium]
MPGPAAFLVQMRHELRNPVNAILGYSQLLLEEADGDALDAEARRDILRIEDAGRQLLRVINEILDPVGSLEQDVAVIGARLRHAVRTPVTSVQGYVEMILEQENEDTPLAKDLLRIHQAAGTLVELTNSMERLYLLRTGASANIEPGESSAEAIQVASTLEQLPKDTTRAGLLLVIDDEEPNRSLLQRRLALQGHDVLLAASGEEGLTLAESYPVDVILLDIMMPGLNGYEVLARIKASARLREIPVLMTTALDEPASISACLQLGAEDYLAKPFEPVVLRARVSSCLARKRARSFELDYLRGVAAVTSAAVAVESGSFDPASLDEVGQRPDALGNLARLFRRVGVEVAARERRLRERVEQLKIEIDHHKKATQVAEITESDYFRGLREQVRGLAARRKDRP